MLQDKYNELGEAHVKLIKELETTNKQLEEVVKWHNFPLSSEQREWLKQYEEMRISNNE